MFGCNIKRLCMAENQNVLFLFWAAEFHLEDPKKFFNAYLLCLFVSWQIANVFLTAWGAVICSHTLHSSVRNGPVGVTLCLLIMRVAE